MREIIYRKLLYVCERARARERLESLNERQQQQQQQQLVKQLGEPVSRAQFLRPRLLLSLLLLLRGALACSLALPSANFGERRELFRNVSCERADGLHNILRARVCVWKVES